MVVGLGNPGKSYENTRHNAGFLAADFLAEEIGAEWRTEQKWRSIVADGFCEGAKVIFVKPQTFMNLSGEAVVAVAQFYKIEPKNIIVVHDDIDFDAGTVKIQFDRSAAAHNGIKSIIELLGTQAFHRVRIGVGPKTFDAADFVLGRFSDDELTTIQSQFDSLSEGVRKVIADGSKK